MLPFFWYLFNVMIVSGIFYIYYLVVLRNKTFHHYNRFYLLLSVTAVWLIPLIKINLRSEIIQQVPFHQVLTRVTNSRYLVEQSKPVIERGFDWSTLSLVIFILISAAFLITLVGGIIRIVWLIKTNRQERRQNVIFVFTQTKGTPFSFFNYIFWDEIIDLPLVEGSEILQHELTHVREKHSLDKILVGIVFIMGWFNPFMWLIRKELFIIHEFIADQKSTRQGNASVLASTLLKISFPQSSSILINSFFHSPIKRRLFMISNLKKTHYSHLRRLMILPLFSLVVIFFAFKQEEVTANSLKTVFKKAIHYGTSDKLNIIKREEAESNSDGFPFDAESNIAKAPSTKLDKEKLELTSTSTLAVSTPDPSLKESENAEAAPGEIVLRWPVDNPTITVHFGPYTIPCTSPCNSLHGTSDVIRFATESGAHVKAAFDGKVSAIFNIGTERDVIMAVIIKHDDYFTTYSNLTASIVTKGQEIKAGDLLGYAATDKTGHGQVDFMLSDNKGKPLDPEKYLLNR